MTSEVLMRRLLLALSLFACLAGCAKRDVTSRPAERMSGNEANSGGPTPTAQAPARSDQEVVLDAVIRDLLTNPLLEHARDWYGTPGGKQIGLSTKSGVPWPAKYTPSVAGYAFQYLDPDRELDPATPRQLGITIHHFAFPPPVGRAKNDLYGGRPIAVGLGNMGGQGNGDAPGGCVVYYSVRREDGVWKVEYEGSLDP